MEIDIHSSEYKIKELKEEIHRLKEKLSKKSENLKISNQKLHAMQSRYNENELCDHIKDLNLRILNDKTKNLDKFVYEVKYDYCKEKYIEHHISSFGARWIKEELAIHIAREEKIRIYTSEIKIISAKKLW